MWYWFALPLFAGLHWASLTLLFADDALALVRLAKLHWSSLVFAGINFVEKQTKECLMVFWLILTVSVDSCRFNGPLLFLLDSVVMFGVCY